MGRLLGRDKKEVCWAKLAGFGERRCTGQNRQGFSGRGCRVRGLCARRP